MLELFLFQSFTFSFVVSRNSNSQSIWSLHFIRLLLYNIRLIFFRTDKYICIHGKNVLHFRTKTLTIFLNKVSFYEQNGQTGGISVNDFVQHLTNSNCDNTRS